MKKRFLVLFCLFSLSIFSQKKKSTKIGNVNIDELKMSTYEKDSTANAVVLFEHANYYLDESKEYKKTTDYYFKIKILKKEGAEKATIKIPFYGEEKVHSIKGITYNLSENNSIHKTHLLESKIYTKDLYTKWKELTFTLPNIKEGSVIEYTYSITSPYSKIDDWYFQSDIPKIKSDFTASILGNWKYNIRVIGFLKLIRNNASVKKNCISIPGLGSGSCLILEYGIDDVPAFKEEVYMLSKENFISKVSFELESYTSTNGGTEKFTKTWKDADRSLKYDFLDNQTSKKSFFKKQLDPSILTTINDLERAKKVYSFIQNYFHWNKKYWPSKKVRIKEAFENKSGNIFDINLALYNSLQAAEIESYLTLTSTRNRAVPTKLHPVIDEFNYLIVKIIIDNKTYFLDATKKQLPFGLVQYQALNGDGRVMDFKNGSFWETITSNKKTYRNTKAQLTLNDNNELSGNLMISNDGYFAVKNRDKLTLKSHEDFVENFESDHPNIEIEDFDFKNIKDNDKALHQIYNITFDEVDFKNKLRLNPFLIKKHTVNPFKLNTREYPVDFAYPRNDTYMLSLNLPDNYTIKKLPENKTLSLPNKGGRYILSYRKNENTLTVYARISINKKVYSSEEYHYLKEFYNQIIKTQDVFIEIEKVSE